MESIEQFVDELKKHGVTNEMIAALDSKFPHMKDYSRIVAAGFISLMNIPDEDKELLKEVEFRMEFYSDLEMVRLKRQQEYLKNNPFPEKPFAVVPTERFTRDEFKEGAEFFEAMVGIQKSILDELPEVIEHSPGIEFDWKLQPVKHTLRNENGVFAIEGLVGSVLDMAQFKQVYDHIKANSALFRYRNIVILIQGAQWVVPLKIITNENDQVCIARNK